MNEKPPLRKASIVTASLLVLASLAALPGIVLPAQAEEACSEHNCVVVDPNPGSGVELPDVETQCSTSCGEIPVRLIVPTQGEPTEILPAITVWSLTCVFETGTSLGDPTIPFVSTQDSCPLGMEKQDSSSQTFGPIEDDTEVGEEVVGTLTTGPCKITGNLLVAGFGVQNINTSYPCASFEPA